ncbi:FAD-dependent thymidylate synthase [candidate division KSB1 bacterium]|nr:FAD-dependent thymidylate synthase [candidate division KSB1 bacterium]
MPEKTKIAAEIIGKAFPCLDHGFVRLVDYMGSDEAVVQAARVSYGEGTRKLREDRGLIRYLMRHQHTTPFEMVEFKFHCKMPIFVARQWIRHRTASVNEYSLRYSKAINEFYLPESETLNLQSETNKQGRSAASVDYQLQKQILDLIKTGTEHAWQDYEKLEATGLSRELARINLPLSLYTEWYWKIDLHNLLHFLKLRLDEHAQYEIRVFASAIAEIIKIVTPIAWEAFEDYVLKAMTFSREELFLLTQILRLEQDPTNQTKLIESSKLSKREIDEFLVKLNVMKKLLHP